MKKLTVMLLVNIITIFALPVYAGGIGYIDYLKVVDNYQFAKNIAQEIENRGNSIQKYIEQKEAEFNKLETPLQKKKFEESVQAELKIKNHDFNNFRNSKEEAVYTRIHAVSEKIRLEKGYDAIFDSRSVFSGGTDITELLIKTLNNSSQR